MTKILFAFVAAVVFCSACDELEKIAARDPQESTSDSVIVYTIPAGAHSSNESSAKLMTKSRIKFKVRFDSSAIYQTKDKNNQADINKLYGMSDCNSSHHVNSARFGWRWYQNRLEIHAYTYSNSQRNHSFVGAVPLNSYNTYEISFTDSSYVFRLNGSTPVQLPRTCSSTANGYKLFPYFGGDEVSPHEIKINIQDID